uniref:Uncharacterized protein n=1 Tax=Panagrolaimus sp. JU765 TaxID=591449 RepID=A0AC34R743_9BILA
MQISLCSSCFQAVGKHLSDVEVDKSTEYYNCSLCFGLMDQQIYSSIIDEAKKEFLKEKFDGETFVLAVNFPVSQLLREKLIETIIGKEWSEQEMSPKSRSTFLMMNQFREDGFLRPSLHSDMILTVTFENDEFKNKDVDFFMCHQPTQFLKTGRKRQAENEED